MLYVFLGQDSAAKDTALKQIQEQHLAPGTRDFNSDTLYGGDITLQQLQEKLLFLPSLSATRVIMLNNAAEAAEPVRSFLLDWAKNKHPGVLLIIEVRSPSGNSFAQKATALADKVYTFSRSEQPDVFALARQVEARNGPASLRILNGLLRAGEKPERILGGLRASWERNTKSQHALKKRMQALLQSDIEIKTGKLKPSIALEKMVVSLCALTEPDA